MSRSLIFLLLAFAPQSILAQPVLATAAGTDWLFPDDGRQALNAPLGGSSGFAVATDPQGNYYIADADNHMIMRVATDGILRVIAGNGIPGYSGDQGPAITAALGFPVALAFDAAGDLYVASLNRIRKIGRNGIITTVAGNGLAGYSGDGGPALSASLNSPTDLAVDASGNIYVADTLNHRIRRIAPGGTIATVAGTVSRGFSGDGGPALLAALDTPSGVALDSAGNLYIADTVNGRIRRITTDGNISTLAGGGSALEDGEALAARIVPRAVRVETTGSVVIADVLTHRVRRISAGRIATVAGAGVSGYAGDGGPAVQARLSMPLSVAIDASQNVYIADSGNSRIRRVSGSGVVNTVAGNGLFRTAGDGTPAPATVLYLPTGVAVDPAGNLYLSEPFRNRVRRVSQNILGTIAGTGEPNYSGDGGPAASAALFNPAALAVDPASGTLFIADQLNNRVRAVDPSGAITTVAGTGIPGFSGDGGPATSASLAIPEGLAVAGGELLISDTANNRIRRVAASGTIETIAGTGEAGFSGDGGPALSASLSQPRDLAVDAAGNVYFSDSGNHRVRRIDIYGNIATVAGTGVAGFSGDGGPATSAALSSPAGLVLDGQGNLYIADEQNHRVRRMGPDGVIATAAGNGLAGFSGDGDPATQESLSGPRSLAIDSIGNIFVADRLNHRIRQIKATPPFLGTEPTQLVFEGNSRAANPPSQTVRLFTGVPGVPYTVSVATEAGGEWLTVNPAGGTLPATLEISVTAANLTFGTYRGTVTIAAPLASPPVATVGVEFRVAPALPPRLVARPEALTFSFVENAPPASQSLTVSNLGSGSADFTAIAATSSGGNWLQVRPATASANALTPGATLQVEANPAALRAGTYSGRIQVVASAGQQPAVTIPVVMIVSAVPQSIVLSPAGLTFTAVQNGGVAPFQSFTILNGGGGTLSWTARATVLSEGPQWLSLSPPSGSVTAAFTGSTVDVRVNSAGLSPGTYYGQVEVASPEAVNSPQLVAVAFNVLPAGTDPGPVVQPVGLLFRANQRTSPGSQNVVVSNLSDRPVTFRSARVTVVGKEWFVHLPGNATVTPERPVRIVVQPQTEGLPPGIYEGKLTLLFDGAVTRTVRIVLVNAPPAAAPAANGVRAADGCVPTKLVPVISSVGLEAIVPAGFPNRLTADVADDCANPLVDGSVVTEFSNTDPPLTMTSSRDGKWSGIWQVRSAAPQVTIRLNASNPVLKLEGKTEVTAALQPAGDAPLVSAGGVVSAGSFAPRQPLAPGSLIAIFGSRLADQPGTSTALPLATELGGTSVTVAGRRLPLLVASENQINAMVPYDLPVNATHQLVVKKGNRIAAPEPVTAADAQPSILSVNQSGQGQGVIVDTQNRIVDGTVTARPGDIVVIYCLGLGAVNPMVVAGSAAPQNPLALAVHDIALTIGGLPATIQFAGLAPGFAGLYQINAVIPQGVTPGPSVPVVLRVAGQESTAVTIAIQ